MSSIVWMGDAMMGASAWASRAAPLKQFIADVMATFF